MRVAPLLMLVLLSLTLAGCSPGGPSPSRPAWSTSIAPPPSTAGPAPPLSGNPTILERTAFPRGLDAVGSGRFYAETDGAVVRFDLARRTLERIVTPRLDEFRSFVATRRLLVVKRIWEGTGFSIAENGNVGELPAEFGVRGRLYPAGRDGIWVVPEEPTGDRSVLSEFSTASGEPKLLGRRAIPAAFGIPDSDSAGQLVATSGAAMYLVTRSSSTRLLQWRRGGEVLGVGKTTILVKSCSRCGVTLRNRDASDKGRRATTRGLRAVDELIATYDYSADGLLSPSGRYLAMTVTMNNDRRDFRLAVTDLISGKTMLIPGAMTRVNANDQFAWLSQTSDRWLLAVSDQTLRIMDTKTGTVHTWRELNVDRIAVVG